MDALLSIVQMPKGVPVGGGCDVMLVGVLIESGLHAGCDAGGHRTECGT
jgi:phosphoribosylcarboxyaminoimidazole (NCAIR) mutase